MFDTAILAAALAITFASARPVARAPGADNTELIATLKTDATRLDRFNDILTDGQKLLTGEKLKEATVFDINNVLAVPGGQGGTVSNAYVDNFPLLIDSGISFSVASLGPCGAFFPHVHPRANELFTVIEGELDFGTTLETAIVPGDPNAAPAIDPVSGTLRKFEGTVFPQGSVHFQINKKCEPATIVATLSNEDAGTTAILQQPNGSMEMEKGKRQADIGDIESYYAVLPPALVSVAKECVARCSS